MISLSTGMRTTAFAYNTEGFLSSVTDPLGYTTTYEYDPVGRVTKAHRPDGSSLWYTYDGNGNMEILTTPSDVDHIFGYNNVNMNNFYQTPLSGGYSYVYDRDRRLIRTNYPSGAQIINIYDKTRLVQIQTPEGTIDYTYLCGAKVGSITDGTDTITYNYDGTLVTGETFSGAINQTLYYTYNSDFTISGFTYAGAMESYTYDNDGLLTSTGRFSISRNLDNGLPESMTDGSMVLDRTFNGYGEVDGESYGIAGSGIITWDVIRDDNGRIKDKAETIDGVTEDYSYTYDSLGRLLTVTKNSVLVEEYQYGDNGARSYEMNDLRGITGRSLAYSEEDHLLTAGTATYQYDLDGFLTAKTDEGEETLYDYSTRGELLGVTLPDGTTIDYVYDPLGRRIAKNVGGTVTEKYLWQGLTRLLAVYDGNDNIMMRFEYADGRMPFAMIKAGVNYYLTYDQVGSLRIIADASGNVVKQIEYDSFGNIITDSNPSFEITFGFAGGLFDKDTDLIRFGYRDYDPDIGRWTAKDPIFFAGGDTDLYRYCINDPVNRIDPEGQFAGVAIGAISGAYAGFLSGIQSGNVWTGIAAGALGGLAGGIVGFIAPQLGGIVGKIAGGVVGGAVGGGLGKAWSKPCASGWEIARAVVKGAGIGALTGYMGGGMISSITAAGVPEAVASMGAAMFTAPINWGLGMATF
jgi:RHS repeat-associated protein